MNVDSGGHVLSVGAIDRRVKAVISQVSSLLNLFKSLFMSCCVQCHSVLKPLDLPRGVCHQEREQEYAKTSLTYKRFRT